MRTRGGLAMRVGSMWPLIGEAFWPEKYRTCLYIDNWTVFVKIGVFLVKFRKINIEIGIQMGFAPFKTSIWVVSVEIFFLDCS